MKCKTCGGKYYYSTEGGYITNLVGGCTCLSRNSKDKGDD